MQSPKTLLIFALGIAGLMILSGAFERFIGWDRKKSAAMNGVLTIGLAIGGAYLAHTAGLIDGDTRNMVITGGVAVGAMQIAGQKLFDFGSDIAGRFSKGGSNTSPAASKPSGALASGPTGINGAVTNFGAGSPLDMLPEGLKSALPAATNPTSTAPAGAVYNINVEAAKAVKPNVGLELGKAGIAAAGSVLSSFLGSKGSDSDLQVLGSF